MKHHAPEHHLDDTVTEHDKKLPVDPHETGDPSSPQGWFWHPEEADREQRFHDLRVPGFDEPYDRDRRAPGAIAPNRLSDITRSPDPDDLSHDGLPVRRPH